MTDSILPADDEQDSVFVQEMARHGDGMTAIVRSGIRDPRYSMEVVLRKTLERPEIRAAVKALERIEKATAPSEITRDSVVADMQHIYEKAESIGDIKGAIAAKRLQADLMGFLEQKIAVTHTMKAEEMTDAQLMRIAQQKQRGLPAPTDAEDAEFEEVEEDGDA